MLLRDKAPQKGILLFSSRWVGRKDHDAFRFRHEPSPFIYYVRFHRFIDIAYNTISLLR